MFIYVWVYASMLQCFSKEATGQEEELDKTVHFLKLQQIRRIKSWMFIPPTFYFLYPLNSDQYIVCISSRKQETGEVHPGKVTRLRAHGANNDYHTQTQLRVVSNLQLT